MSDIDTVREALEVARLNAQTAAQAASADQALTALQSLEEENKRLREATEWRDIASAPRDGTVIWIKGGRFDSAYSQIHGMKVEDTLLVFYAEKVNKDMDPPWTTAGGYPVNIKNPTHWKPLDQPQSQEKTDDE